MAFGRVGLALEAMGQFEEAVTQGYGPALQLDASNEQLAHSHEQARAKALARAEVERASGEARGASRDVAGTSHAASEESS